MSNRNDLLTGSIDWINVLEETSNRIHYNPDTKEKAVEIFEETYVNQEPVHKTVAALLVAGKKTGQVRTRNYTIQKTRQVVREKHSYLNTTGNNYNGAFKKLVKKTEDKLLDATGIERDCYALDTYLDMLVNVYRAQDYPWVNGLFTDLKGLTRFMMTYNQGEWSGKHPLSINTAAMVYLVKDVYGLNPCRDTKKSFYRVLAQDLCLSDNSIRKHYQKISGGQVSPEINALCL